MGIHRLSNIDDHLVVTFCFRVESLKWFQAVNTICIISSFILQIRILWDVILSKFWRYYDSGQHITLDEGVILFRGHKLFIDNFYTDPQLAWKLIKLKIFITGIIKVNRRGLPAKFDDLKLKLMRRKTIPEMTFYIYTI